MRVASCALATVALVVLLTVRLAVPLAIPLAFAACTSSATPAERGIHFVAGGADDPATHIVQTVSAEAARGRRVLVYVGAAWCEPCRAFHDAATAGTLNDAFPALTLLEYDADKDGARLQAAGYDLRMIPLFAVPAPDGRASTRAIAGARRGDWVGDITPRLRALLDTQ